MEQLFMSHLPEIWFVVVTGFGAGCVSYLANKWVAPLLHK